MALMHRVARFLLRSVAWLGWLGRPVSNFDPSKLARPVDSDRPVLANSKAMAFEFASFLGNATELMQVPQSASDLVDGPMTASFAITIDLVANHPAEHSGLRVRWRSGAGWFLAFADRSLGGQSNCAGRMAERSKVGWSEPSF